MKKLLLVFAIGAFSVSCGPSLCDCVNESKAALSGEGEISEACAKMSEENMKLTGDEAKAKMEEMNACK